MAQKYKNGGFLPYYRGKSSREEAELSVYLRHKFVPFVRRQFPQHGLVQLDTQRASQMLLAAW